MRQCAKYLFHKTTDSNSLHGLLFGFDSRLRYFKTIDNIGFLLFLIGALAKGAPFCILYHIL